MGCISCLPWHVKRVVPCRLQHLSSLGGGDASRLAPQRESDASRQRGRQVWGAGGADGAIGPTCLGRVRSILFVLVSWICFQI